MKRLEFLKNSNVILFFFITAIFLMIYNKFIFGNFAYLYKDIGGDTFVLGYPTKYYVLNAIQNFDFNLFDLTVGFGGTPLNFYFTNFPFMFLLSFIPAEFTHIVILLMAYIEYLVIAFFGYYYFKNFSNDKVTLLIVSILWSYSSFNVLWGQHDFAYMVMLFTIHMFLLERCLKLGGKNYIYLAINLTIFSLSVGHIFFLYITTVFTIFYIFVRKYSEGNSIYKIFLSEIKVGVCYLFGFGLAAIALFTNIETMLESTRSVTSFNFDYFTTLSTYFVLDKATFTTNLARMLGNDIFALDSNFMSVSRYLSRNYYEAPMLFVSLLFFFAAAELTNYKKYGKTWILLLCLIIAFIFMPIFNDIFTLASSFRWSFIIIFLMLLFILKYLNIEKIRYYNIILGFLAIALVTSASYNLIESQGFHMSIRNIIVIVAFASLYLSALLLSHFKLPFNFKYLIFAIALFEVVFFNYNSVNNRGEVPLPLPHYSEKKSRAVNYIQNKDKSLYRMISSGIFFNVSEPLVYGSKGLSIYSSLVPKVVKKYIEENDVIVWSPHGNIYQVSTDDKAFATLLGVKYLFIDKLGDTFDSSGYELATSGLDIDLYYNPSYLPFGYTYFSQVDKDYYLGLTKAQKDSVALKSFYSNEIKLFDYSEETAENVDELRKVTLNGVTFEDSTLRGVFNNNVGVDGLMVVPVFDIGKWTLKIDGIEREVYQVNGGLIGFIAPTGKHFVELSWQPKSLITSIIVTITTMTLIVIIITLIYMRRITKK